jgi:hypothetical protein
VENYSGETENIIELLMDVLIGKLKTEKDGYKGENT